jgi:hypothetical protein
MRFALMAMPENVRQSQNSKHPECPMLSLYHTLLQMGSEMFQGSTKPLS